MKIELMDMDVPYEVRTDITADGTEIVRIVSNPSAENRDDSYDICLEKVDVEELIGVLEFLKGKL